MTRMASGLAGLALLLGVLAAMDGGPYGWLVVALIVVGTAWWLVQKPDEFAAFAIGLAIVFAAVATGPVLIVVPVLAVASAYLYQRGKEGDVRPSAALVPLLLVVAALAALFVGLRVGPLNPDIAASDRVSFDGGETGNQFDESNRSGFALDDVTDEDGVIVLREAARPDGAWIVREPGDPIGVEDDFVMTVCPPNYGSRCEIAGSAEFVEGLEIPDGYDVAANGLIFSTAPDSDGSFDVQGEVMAPSPESDGGRWWLWLALGLLIAGGLAFLIMRFLKRDRPSDLEAAALVRRFDALSEQAQLTRAAATGVVRQGERLRQNTGDIDLDRAGRLLSAYLYGGTASAEEVDAALTHLENR